LRGDLPHGSPALKRPGRCWQNIRLGASRDMDYEPAGTRHSKGKQSARWRPSPLSLQSVDARAVRAPARPVRARPR